MRTREWTSGLVVLAMVVTPFLAFATGTEEAAQVTTLKVAHYFGVDHPLNVNLTEVFQRIVEEETDLVVEIYPSNQLGGESEFTEGVMMGVIEMAVTGNMWEMYNERVSFMQLPYLFVNMDHAYDAMNGPVGQNVYDQLFYPLGIEVLGYFSQGGRALSNNVRPITSPEDTAGITMRTWQGTTIIEIMERFGFDVTVMAMSELFTALQTGVVDAQDNPVSATYHQGWFEVLDYVSITNHIIAPNYFVANSQLMSRLTDEQRAVVERAAARTVEQTHHDLLVAEREIIERIRSEMGVEVVYPDVAPFMERVAPMLDAFQQEYPEVRELIAEIRRMGEQYL